MNAVRMIQSRRCNRNITPDFRPKRETIESKISYFGATAVPCGIAPPSGFEAIPSAAADRRHGNIMRVWGSFAMSAFGVKRHARASLTHDASVDCLFYLSNRGLRRQGISGRSNRDAVSAVPNEGFER